MDPIQKFLRKLTPKRRSAIVRALRLLATGNTEGLDIMPLQGRKRWFRCRIGDIRIIFIRTETGKHIVYDIQLRDKAYQNL